MIADKVDTLHSCLLRLPKSLPLASEISQYNFSHFSPYPDWIEDAGEEAATNRELEVILGSRAKGLVLPECGPKFIYSFPNSVLPLLWLTDITKAAETAIVTTGMQVCSGVIINRLTGL
ncbi:hypothetical protein L208DRAFT_1396303 [Tricholoma matsutake]|nr:hypothetical protein L208DRAFT_1396303 [Tricholoma matsutake 945]